MTWVSKQLLTAIGEHGETECVTEARMMELTGLTARQVDSSARKLRKHGLLEKTGRGCHKLTDAGKEALKSGANVQSGPKGEQPGKRVQKNSLRGRIWRAIRIRRKFSVPEIISLVADETARGDITSGVQKYIRILVRAGYLVELPKREKGTALTSNGYKRYWLTDDKDTGPLAPVWRADYETVYDPNTEVEIDISREVEA